MSTSLMSLVAEYRDAADRLAEMELDDQTMADTLESLTGPLEDKCYAVAHVLMDMNVLAAALKDQAVAKVKRAKAMEAASEALRSYLGRSMEAAGIQRLEGPAGKISFRASTAVVIDGADLLPAEYMRTPEPPPPAPDKVRLAAALKAGQTIPGAHLESRRHVVIAP